MSNLDLLRPRQIMNFCIIAHKTDFLDFLAS
jgi:hypothetical protein